MEGGGVCMTVGGSVCVCVCVLKHFEAISQAMNALGAVGKADLIGRAKQGPELLFEGEIVRGSEETLILQTGAAES